MRILDIGRAAAFPLVAVLLVAAATVVPRGSDADESRPPTSVPVTQSSYACPAGPVITVASGQVAPGTSATATALPSRTPDQSLGDAGAWRTGVVDGQGVVVDQQGRGSGAVGYFAGTAPKSGGGGLVVGSCTGVVDDAWLMGLGSGNGHFSTLILTNLASTPAAVDLSLWGPQGPIDAVDADGIVVEPFSVRRIRLDSLAAGESEIAVHLQRRRGSLSAVVNDTSTATFKGTEPISAALSPRRTQVVGGLVGGASGRTLLVLNPGRSTARVGVEVIGKDGTFTPTGLEQVTVKAGTVQAVTVPDSAGADEQALRLTSDRPVAATVRMAPTADDYAYAEPGAPLSGPAVVPVDLGSVRAAPSLVLTAPGGAAEVEVQGFDASMKPLASSTVTIAAGTTSAVRPEVDGAAYLVLRPTGRVVAAATYADGDALSSLALSAAPVSVQAPQVRPAG
ncbi:DUF5719 family protein [Aeromicrobium endophyticum]|uniref:DUF5719 family protein n=1 Tax=Aeromicrobium endophyticum TaxID=2292704 RepID=UPI0013148506|nr:DUF5719 family protein [Aeromicrobium endophyticum]